MEFSLQKSAIQNPVRLLRPLAHLGSPALVKALHLRYPARAGRRLLKLETLAGDTPDAIDRLLHAHADALTLTQLTVCYAELQVRLVVFGRRKHFLIRLWPNRCNLSQTPLGDRFRACLRRWGLCYG